MKYIESSITSSFTIGHAKGTLEEICSNINRQLNNPNSDLDKKQLDRISRHLHNAIDNIKEAEEVIEGQLEDTSKKIEAKVKESKLKAFKLIYEDNTFSLTHHYTIEPLQTLYLNNDVLVSVVPRVIKKCVDIKEV